MVKTVGPASSRAPPTSTSRILPPGAAARSTTTTPDTARRELERGDQARDPGADHDHRIGAQGEMHFEHRSVIDCL